MTTIHQLRRIINNGYVKKTRKMLKPQVIGLSENEIFNAMTLSNIKVKPFAFNSKHRINSLVTTQNPKTCEVIKETDSNKFFQMLKKLFDDPIDQTTDVETIEKVSNFVVKKNGNDIGIFSLDIVDDSIRIGNFGIEKEYRNTKTVMESLLAIRDSIIDFAKANGISKIVTEVNDGNKQLLSLYQRFGFKPLAEINFNSSIMDINATQHLLEAII